MDHPEHDTPIAIRQVERAEFRDNMAELRPPSPPGRLPGAMRGKIWMADDFDTWPEGFIDEMVDGPIFPPEDKGE